MNNDLLIWWTTEAECKAIGERLPKVLPVYLRDQYLSRWGRNGRGRLWAAEKFGDVGIEPWPQTKLANFVGEWAGGIVIRAGDRDHLKTFPGIITDLELNRA